MCQDGADPLTCVKDQSLAGADFCLSCIRTEFFPLNVTKIDSIEQYFYMQASMVARTQVQLTPEQLRYIADNFDGGEKNFSIKNFMNRRINLLPDGTVGDAPLTLTGLRVPEGIDITSTTSYRELYAAQHARYNFPKQSLFENRCLSFCPAGFTDINGFCLACSAPCATCDGGRDRCLTCLQDPALNPERKNYAFGRACYTECPVNTVTDEANKRCLGCGSGCRIC